MTNTKPIVTGSFIQPDLCKDWTVEDFKNHFRKFTALSMDTFILQWISTTPQGKIDAIYYDSKIPKSNFTVDSKIYPTMVENCLNAAQQCGIKVFVGINLADEWWSYPLEKQNWIDNQTHISNLIANELYTLYKDKYPDAFYGWYWAWEMSNGMNSHEEQYAKMLNKDLETFSTIDNSMPFLMSPFNTLNSTPYEAYNEWNKFFSLTNFRDGDIFCCQDAVGAAWITIDRLDEYYSSIKKAVDENGKLKFWANSENFNSNFTPSTLDRFYDQLQIAKKYCEKIISFSFCHYYFDSAKTQGYIDAYSEYYQTLEKDTIAPKECLIEYEKADDLSGTLRLIFDDPQVQKVNINYNKTQVYSISVNAATYEKSKKGEKYILDIPVVYQQTDYAHNFEIDIFDYWNNKTIVKYTAQ